MTKFERYMELCQDWRWRVRNLYVYHDQVDGQIKPYRLNEAQEYFDANRAPFTHIIKTRREGFSTHIVNESADWCIWVPGQRAALIDYKKEDAKLKLQWAALCWKHIGKFTPGLTQEEGMDFNATLRSLFPLARINSEDPGKEAIEWANGSLYYASTSVRGGMVNCGHLSELGPIAAKSTTKASDIMAGMAPAVAPGNRFTIETTHEGGKYGKNWELIEQALKKAGGVYNEIEFKLLFFSFLNSNKSIPARNLRLDEEEKQIIEDYRSQGVTMDADRWAYWFSQYRKLRERTFAEFPLVFDDITRSPVVGSIFGKVLYQRQLDGACCSFPIERKWPCYVGVDLGQRDAMALWLVQKAPMEWRWLDYYQCHYQNPAHLVEKLRHWERWCNIEHVLLPHDGKKTENSGKTYVDYLKELGVENVKVVPLTENEWLGIHELRSMFEASVFHKRVVDGYQGFNEKGEVRQIAGFELLRNFRAEVVEDGKAMKNKPIHDHTSHCSSAARTIAEGNLQGWVSQHLNPGEKHRPLVVRR